VWISSIAAAEAEQTGKLTRALRDEPRRSGRSSPLASTCRSSRTRHSAHQTAWGGKSLNTDFRPPSARAIPVSMKRQLAVFPQQGKDLAAIKARRKRTGVNYHLMIEHVKKVLGDTNAWCQITNAAQGYELAVLCGSKAGTTWWTPAPIRNRDKPGGYDAYSTAMAHFIRDVRKD